jgi:hypothetical protein
MVQRGKELSFVVHEPFAKDRSRAGFRSPMKVCADVYMGSLFRLRALPWCPHSSSSATGTFNAFAILATAVRCTSCF